MASIFEPHPAEGFSLLTLSGAGGGAGQGLKSGRTHTVSVKCLLCERDSKVQP